MPTTRVPGVIRPRSAAADEDAGADEDDASLEEASEDEASLEDASLEEAAELDGALEEAALDGAALDAAAEVLFGELGVLLLQAARTAAQSAIAASASPRRPVCDEVRMFTVFPFRVGEPVEVRRASADCEC